MQEAVSAPLSNIRVVASKEAAAFVRAHGGRLFVWPSHHRCCGGRLTLLEASTVSPGRARMFHSLDAGDFVLYLDSSVRTLPQELNVELRGLRRKRIDVFWDGCAFVL